MPKRCGLPPAHRQSHVPLQHGRGFLFWELQSAPTLTPHPYAHKQKRIAASRATLSIHFCKSAAGAQGRVASVTSQSWPSDDSLGATVTGDSGNSTFAWALPTNCGPAVYVVLRRRSPEHAGSKRWSRRMRGDRPDARQSRNSKGSRTITSSVTFGPLRPSSLAGRYTVNGVLNVACGLGSVWRDVYVWAKQASRIRCNLVHFLGTGVFTDYQ